MNIPVPPFQIICTGHSYPQTDMDRFCSGPNDSDEIYLSVVTPASTWYCHIKRGHMSKLFEEINRNLPTPIEFKL